MAAKVENSELAKSLTEKTLLLRKFFEFFPEKLYNDLYGAGYNAFLTASSTMKDVLVDEFPENRDIVSRSCSDMLDHFETEYADWFKAFTEYCDQNVFILPPNLSLFEPEMEGGENVEKFQVLQDKLLGQAYRRKILIQKLENIEDEIEKRKALLDKVSRTEELVHHVKKCEALDQRIRAAKVTEN